MTQEAKSNQPSKPAVFTLTFDPQKGSIGTRLEGDVPAPMLVYGLWMALAKVGNEELGKAMVAQMQQEQGKLVVPGGAPLPKLTL